MPQNKIYIASCADDGYAMPLAAMIASVLASLDADYKPEFFIMDGGISEVNKEKILKSFSSKNIYFHWLIPEREKFQGIVLAEHISLAAYYKIAIPNRLPSDIPKVIFLDADLIVLRDLSLLWNQDMSEKILLAVQDMALPYIDSSKGCKNFEQCQNYLEASVAIADYWKDGLDPTTPYFNSGVMIIDVEKWRANCVEQKMTEYLIRNTWRNKYFDQDGFNAILFRDWKPLDPRWNQISSFWNYPSPQQSPFDERTFMNIRNDPYIVHFVSASKPWHFGNAHPKRAEFLRFVRMTSWRNWRPNLFQTLYIRMSFLVRNARNRVLKRFATKQKFTIIAVFLALIDVLVFLLGRTYLFFKKGMRGARWLL